MQTDVNPSTQTAYLHALYEHVVLQPLSTSAAVDMLSLLLCERLGDALATLLQGIRDARQNELQVCCTELSTVVKKKRARLHAIAVMSRSGQREKKTRTCSIRDLRGMEAVRRIVG